MAADNSNDKLYLHANLTQTPIITADKLIHIPGQETIRRRIKRSRTQVDSKININHNADSKIEDSDNIRDNDHIGDEDSNSRDRSTIQHIISILTHVLSMDKNLALNTIHNCLMAYRFFASGIE